MSSLILRPSEPTIELYKTGFSGVCKLGRAEDGKNLSALIESISEPMVIAVDAPWGAGKTVFLKCWVGAHSLENNGSAKTIFFDAFKHDFMDDPLIGLTRSISERLDSEKNKSGSLRKVKESVSKLARPALRIGLAAATYGATDFTGALVDAGLNAGSKELAEASKKFWQNEEGKHEAMRQFRASLEQLALEQKLVIVVDELDRCRPDYALNFLEVIKHFFDVKNVHFVLGVNLKELANSVRARYGAAVQGEKYLQKFITLSMPLIPRTTRSPSTQTQMQHFRRVSEEIGLTHSRKYEWIIDYLRYVNHHAGLSLRDVEKIATLAMVTPAPLEKPSAKPYLFFGALILQILAPPLVEKARSGQMTADEFFSIFDLKSHQSNESFFTDASSIWRLVFSKDQSSYSETLAKARGIHYKDRDPKELLREVISETFDVFQILN